MREVKYPDVHVKLSGRDGNAMSIMGAVASALRKAGHGDEVGGFLEEAMAGDYTHVLVTAMNWVEVS